MPQPQLTPHWNLRYNSFEKKFHGLKSWYKNLLDLVHSLDLDIIFQPIIRRHPRPLPPSEPDIASTDHCWYHQKAQRCKPPSVAGQPQQSCLFYIQDPATKLRFLVDTGAEVSTIPFSCTECRQYLVYRYHPFPECERSLLFSTTYKFPAVTKTCSSNHLVKHNVTNHIQTTGPPVVERTRPLAPVCLKAAR